MRELFASLVLAFSATSFSCHTFGQAPIKDAPQRIGQIFIVGNTVTRQDVILEAIELVPGQVFRQPDLREAEKKLEKLGIFANDPALGIRPMVAVLEGDGQFKDVLISVQETATSCVKLMSGLNANGELVFSVVWEERNFDPFNWPASMEDVKSGRAFRGAGRLFRLELLQIPILLRQSPRIFGLGSCLIPLGALRRPGERDRMGS